MNTENQNIKNFDSSFYSLNKVIGFGSYNSFSLSTNKQNGLTCYITGPFITFYDLKKDKSIYYFKNMNNRAFSCLSFSEHGNYLACGEGYCSKSEIFILDLLKILKDENTSNSSLVKIILKGGHKLSTEKIRFFKNDKFLISIGDREDKYLNIWKLDYIKNTYELSFSMKYNRYIISFDIFDKTIIMGGEKFLKVWNIEEKDVTNTNLSNPNEKENNHGIFNIIKSNIETGKLKDKIFSFAKIFQNKTFILSSDGHLIELDNELKEISRWVNLKTDKALSLTIYQDNLICGCSEGIIRIFNCNTLQYKSTLHRPPPLGKANIDSNTKKINISVSNDEKFADVIYLEYNNYYEKLLSLYSDKTFFIWDLKKTEKIYVYRYNTFHSGSINNMDFIIDPKEEIINFVTCSDDKTVRLWNMKIEDFLSIQGNTENKNWRADSKRLEHIAYSKSCRRIFYFGKKYDHFKTKDHEIINGLNKVTDQKYMNSDLPNIIETDEEEDDAISIVKFSSDLKYLACGDNYGNLYIYEMKTLQQINFVNLHNNQISAIDFFSSEVYKTKDSDKVSNSVYYIATGSLDCLVHIIDINEKINLPFEKLEKITLNDHEAPISGLIFNISNLKNNNFIENINLITFGIDHKIKFYCINSIKSIQLMQSYLEDGLQTYSISWNYETNKIITGHNGKISLWKTYGCRPYKIFDVKLKNNVIEHFRITLDSTGKIIATSCNDKYIRIRSAFDGQLFCKIPIAESISSLYFCLNNQYLIASSIEGYVYFFKIDTQSILDKIKTEIEKQGGDQDDNDDYQSNQSLLKFQINNKIKILEKLLQNELEYSKKEQIKYLIEKMKNNEDLKIEDLRTLDSYYKENKILNKPETIDDTTSDNNKKINNEINSNKNQNYSHSNISSEKNNTNLKNAHNDNEILSNKSEIINLREEVENNKDDGINDPRDEDEHRNSYLTKSIIFEKGLKENISLNGDLKKSIVPSSRISVTDNYYSVLVSNAPKSDIFKNVFKKADSEKDPKIPSNEEKSYRKENEIKNIIEVKLDYLKRKDLNKPSESQKKSSSIEKKYSQKNVESEEKTQVNQYKGVIENPLEDLESNKRKDKNPFEKNNNINVIKNDEKDFFSATNIQSTISNLVNNLNDKLDAARKQDNSNSNNLKDLTSNPPPVLTRNCSSNALIEDKKVNNNFTNQKIIKNEENTQLDELKLLISNTNKYVEDVDNKYKGNQVNELSKSSELTISQSNYNTNPPSARIYNNNLDTQANMDLNDNNIKNNPHAVDICDISKSLIDNSNEDINKFNSILPGQKINNINKLNKDLISHEITEDVLEDSDRNSLFLENLEREKILNLNNLNNKNVFKNNLQDSNCLDQKKKEEKESQKKNNIINSKDNKFMNIDYDNEKSINFKPDEKKYLTNNILHSDIREIKNSNKDHEILEEIITHDSSVIFNNQIILNKEMINTKNSNCNISGTNTYVNTFAKLSVNDNLINETFGISNIHDFDKFKSDNIKIFENTGMTETNLNTQTQTHPDMSNIMNFNSFTNRNNTSIEKNNIIVLSASEFNHKDSKNNITLNKEKDFLNKRHLNKFIKKSDNLAKISNENNSLIISHTNTDNSNLVHLNLNSQDRAKSNDEHFNQNNMENDIINNRDKRGRDISKETLITKTNSESIKKKKENSSKYDHSKNLLNIRKKIHNLQNVNHKTDYELNEEDLINSSPNQKLQNNFIDSKSIEGELNIYLKDVSILDTKLRKKFEKKDKINKNECHKVKEIMMKIKSIYDTLDKALEKNNEIYDKLDLNVISNDKILEKYLEQYSNLLVEKVEKKINKRINEDK